MDTARVTKQTYPLLDGAERDDALRAALEAELTAKHGPLLSGEGLRQILAFHTQSAFRRAASRCRLLVPVFTIAHRRGKVAVVKDIAAWRAERRTSAATCNAEELIGEKAQ